MGHQLVAAALLMLASPARCGDQSIQSGLDYIRSSGETGAAMSDYIAQDPVPIGYSDLPDNVLGLYSSRKQISSDGKVKDESYITLDDKMKTASPREVGDVLFHEYSHRLEDVGGGKLSHKAEDLDGAMETLREKERPGSGKLAPLEDVRRGFARQDAEERGETPMCLKSNNQFALRQFQSFRTGGQQAAAAGGRRVYSLGVPRQAAAGGSSAAPAARVRAATGAVQSRAVMGRGSVGRPAQLRSFSGHAGRVRH